MERYQHRAATSAEGDFEILCVRLAGELLTEQLRLTGDDVTAQIEIGDTYQGDEFKLLTKSATVLRIEVAEKRDANQPNWVRSGIMCERSRYWCGNFTEIFVFKPQTLRRWLAETKPGLVEGWAHGGDQDRPTIRSFELNKLDAREICLFRCVASDGEWRLAHRTRVVRVVCDGPKPFVAGFETDGVVRSCAPILRSRLLGRSDDEARAVIAEMGWRATTLRRRTCSIG